MIGHKFEGQARTIDLPEGGEITFGIGHLWRDKEGEPEEACVTKVLDREGNEIANFALTTVSFGAYLAVIMDIFQRFVPLEGPLPYPLVEIDHSDGDPE